MTTLPRALQRVKHSDGETMEILSDTLEPVVFQDNAASGGFIRFVLPKKAILESGSRLQLGAVSANAATYPTATGIASLIQKVDLLVGGEVIDSVDEFGKWFALQKGFTPTDDRALKGTAKEGVMSAMKIYENQNVVADNGKVGFMKPDSTWTSLQLGTTAANTGRYSIALEDMFHVLRGQQLPLGYMNDNVSIEISLTPNAAAGDRVVMTGGAAFVAATCGILQEELCKLYCDYLVYSPEKMQEVEDAMRDTGLSFVYPQYQHVIKGAVAAGGATDTQESNMELGGTSRRVRALLGVMKRGGNGGVNGKYRADSEVTRELQIEINDQLVFPRPLNSMAKSHYQLADTNRNTGYWTNKSVYSFNAEAAAAASTGQIITTTFDARDLSTAGSADSLQGSYSPFGVFFGDVHSLVHDSGVMVNNKPIRFTYKRTGFTTIAPANTNLRFDFWIVAERAFVMRDGYTTISY